MADAISAPREKGKTGAWNVVQKEEKRLKNTIE